MILSPSLMVMKRPDNIVTITTTTTMVPGPMEWDMVEDMDIIPMVEDSALGVTTVMVMDSLLPLLVPPMPKAQLVLIYSLPLMDSHSTERVDEVDFAREAEKA